MKPADALPWVAMWSIDDQDSILVVFMKPAKALPWVAMWSIDDQDSWGEPERAPH